MSKLAQVNSQYGAPMGRANRDLDGDVGNVKMHLETVPLDSGGYDSGGAYWGLRMPVTRQVLCRPIGHPDDVPPVLRSIRSTPRIYRYYWASNNPERARTRLPVIEGFIEAFDRQDAKAQVLSKYPHATFYK